jgi:hypothetical protein
MIPLRAPFLATLLSTAPLPAAHVWVEGESGVGTNISTNGWYQSVRKDELSGGDWIASFGGKGPATVNYKVNVPEAGTYTLWVRANPVQAALSVRFNEEGDWIKVPISEKKHESINIASDGKPDMRFVAWSTAGSIELPAGPATLTFRMNSKNANHGAIDCLCLNTDSSWKPNMTLKPGDSKPFWPAPALTDENIAKRGDFIRPGGDELGWRKIRWHRNLDEAVAEARVLGRPVLLWSMNGHPCGET